MQTKDFSVIIPTHNCHLEKNFSVIHSIRSILWQKESSVEIIVVDDRGTDGTMDRLCRQFPSLKVVRSEANINNLGHLRNLGASKAAGRLLVFLDDDTVLSDRFVLTRVKRVMRDNDFCCGAHRLWTSIYWYRHIHENQSASLVTRTLRAISFKPQGLNRVNGFRDLNEFTFIGNFGCVRAEVFEATGGFDGDNFPGWGLEDTDYIMRLCLRGLNYSILGDHDVSVFHLNHPADIESDYLINLKKFQDLELERGYYFHTNHFFGVYEGDGVGVFTKI